MPDLEQRASLVVEVLGVAAIDVGRLGRHRRVEVERQRRDLAVLEQPVEGVDDLLRPPDRERRDEQDAARIGDEVHGFGEDPDRLVLGLVLAAAVGRLDRT